ncbi:MAG: lipopolysaccharide biosynthesis protein [Chitinophagaceae bacterium]
MQVTNLLNTHKHSIRNLSLYFTANIIQALIGLLLNPILATHLSPGDFAIVGYYDSFSLFIIPFIGFSLTSYYAKSFFTWNGEQQKEALRSLVLFQGIAGFVTTAILLALLKAYFNTRNVAFSFYPFALLAFGKVYLQSALSFLLLQFRLEKKAKSFFNTSVVYNLINVVFVFLLVVGYKGGAEGRMTGLFLSNLMLGVFCYRKMVHGVAINWSIVKDALRFSWPLMLSALLTYFFTGFDMLLLEREKDVYNLGLYSVALKIASYFLLFSTSIDSTFEPDFYKAISAGNSKKLIRTVVTTNLLKTLPVLVFILFAPYFMGMLTNNRYVEATDFARILSLACITRSISFTLSIIIVACGYPKISLIEKTLGASITVLLYLFLIRTYGFTGAAWGQVLSYLAMSAISGGFIFWLYMNKKIFRSPSTRQP